MMQTENQKTIINALSTEIYVQSFQCAAEQHGPNNESDDYIEQRRLNVMRLRQIRSELEDIFTGFLNANT